MAAKSGDSIAAWVNGQTKEQLEKYKDQSDADTMSEAAAEMIQLGLREADGPLTHQLRDMAIDAAYHLALVSVVTVIVGVMTTALAPGHAMAIALVTLTIGMAPLAAIEVIRWLRGQSDLSSIVGGGAL